MVLPKGVRANLEIRVGLRLVPEHLVLNVVALGVVENHQTLVVLGALVHHLAEYFERRKHPGVALVDALAVGHDVLAQNEHVVDVRTEVRWDAQRVLHRHQEHHLVVPPVHEYRPDVLRFGPAGIVQAVVENQEAPWVDLGRLELFDFLVVLLDGLLLAVEHALNDFLIVLVVNEQRGYHIAVELVGRLGGRDDRAHGDVLVVVQEVFAQEGLAGVALADEDDDLVVVDGRHVEFAEVEVHGETTHE